MYYYVETSLFQSPAQVLVNTVNTQGVMGKGIASIFKQLYPHMFSKYRQFCEDGQFKIGQLWLYKTPQRWILNFPTKQEWRRPSKVEYIEAGLKNFVATYREREITSVSFPMLGCGNGGLDWETQVKPVMEHHLSQLPINIYVHVAAENSLPEHLDIEATERWLRSDPYSLPFSEFWRDFTNTTSTDENTEIDESLLQAFWHDLQSSKFLLGDALRPYTNDVDQFVERIEKLSYIHVLKLTDIVGKSQVSIQLVAGHTSQPILITPTFDTV
jgi:O-acetyl-ADP-ribose deacetylase (regulator of RNase III)